MWTYLWQNFLIDSDIKKYISDKIKKIYDDNQLECIIEIGPWKGAITKKIHNISSNFFVLEKDETMLNHLTEIIKKKDIIFGDVLNVDVHKILAEKNISPQKTLVIWNLPYYITSPIFRKFFANWEKDKNKQYFWWFFMVQDEVWQKVQTETKKKSFLWRLTNYAYNIYYRKTVPAKAFKPAPKVKSCLVEFQKKQEIIDINFNNLFEFLNLHSQFSRKTLWAITKILAKQNKKKFQIPEDLKSKRLEELSWENIQNII